MGSSYEAMEEGWFLMGREFKQCCCDCGLVHRWKFKIRNGKLYAKVDRDNRATGQIRRKPFLFGVSK